MLAALLVALLLAVPGAALRVGFGVARQPWGCGVLAVDATLSLAFLSLVLLPLYLLQAPVAAAPWAVGTASAALVLAAWRARAASQEPALPAPGAWRGEVAVFVVAVASLLPAVLAHSGANVDDWWDLSFVAGWLADGRFGFAQAALSPDPASGASPVHPRFLWSGWLMLQATIAAAGGGEPWRVQAGPLAAASILLAVSAQAALAHALFRASPARRALVAATIAATAAWIWSTEALPLFVRAYQDKLFAAFVLAPVLVALVLEASRACDAGADAGGPGRRERGLGAVAAAAFATVSVHSLVFTMAAFVALVAVAAAEARATLAWWKARARIGAALGAAAAYPVGQALALAVRFGEQGISLAVPDNPVVRAHLALGRLLAPWTAAWVVHPGAVFGPLALLVPWILVRASRRRRDEAARALLAMTLVPCALLFVPGLAAVAGALWVPWMLYRLGWLVPVAPLLGWVLVDLASRPGPWRRAFVAGFVVVALAVVATTGADRARRGFREHPGPAAGAPVGAAAVVLDFLAAQPGRSPVLAPPNFAEFVPARAGKPVVAFSERGTLVFAGDEARAYERLRDRAQFFFAGTDAAARDRVAERYAVRWAVLPRRLVASGSEEDWAWRFGADALVAARTCDDGGDPGCRGWWSSTRRSVGEGLPGNWRVALETRDYFVVERGAAAKAAPAPQRDEGTAHTGRRWLRPFALTPAVARPPRLDVLGTAAAAPGAALHYDVPPRSVLPSAMPVWIEGPRPWEDAPADVAIRIDLGLACRIHAVEVVPRLARDRREVLDVRVDDARAVEVARDGEAIVVVVGDGGPRSSIGVEVRSELGNPLSLADVRVLGDAASCAAGWPVHREPVALQLAAGPGVLLDFAVRHPSSARAWIALARRVNAARGPRAAVPVLEAAVARDPSLVEAWIELGFARDAVVEQRDDATPGIAGPTVADARAAFDSAVHADSNSAWARGCAAWSDRRAGCPVVAIAQAVVAATLDPDYADAWTILAYALGDLHLDRLAGLALDRAEVVDPDRNWPLLARADLARRDGGEAALEQARRALEAWMRAHPFDRTVQERLSALGAPPEVAR